MLPTVYSEYTVGNMSWVAHVHVVGNFDHVVGAIRVPHDMVTVPHDMVKICSTRHDIHDMVVHCCPPYGLMYPRHDPQDMYPRHVLPTTYSMLPKTYLFLRNVMCFHFLRPCRGVHEYVVGCMNMS
jgi:hypothetical protein